MAEEIEDTAPVTDEEILDAMARYGGSFVKGLARLWPFADAANQARLKAAFPDYWAQYAKTVEMQRQRDANARRES